MSAAWMLGLLSLGQAAMAEGDRVPLPLVILTPTSQVSHVSRSALLRLSSELIEDVTSYRVVEAESEALTGCNGRLACLTEQALAGTSGQPRHLLLLTSLPQGGKGDLLSALLIDVPEALAILATLHGSDPRTEDQAELAFSTRAMTVPEQREVVVDEAAARSFLGSALFDHFRPVLAAAGVWAPYGGLVVECPVDGLTLSIDGRPVGTTAQGEIRINRVHVGARKLLATGAPYAPLEQTFEVRAGETARIVLNPEVEYDYTPIRRATWIAGATMGLMGGLLMAYGLSVNPAGVECVSTAGTCVATREFTRFGVETDPRRVSLTSSPNGNGFAIFPLGVALFSTGAVFSLGTLLIGEAQDLPWPQWLVGIGLGLLAYQGLLLTETRGPF